MKTLKRLLALAGVGACLVACPKDDGGPKEPGVTPIPTPMVTATPESTYAPTPAVPVDFDSTESLVMIHDGGELQEWGELQFIQLAAYVPANSATFGGETGEVCRVEPIDQPDSYFTDSYFSRATWTFNIGAMAHDSRIILKYPDGTEREIKPTVPSTTD